MIPYDDAFETALAKRKYDVLTQRTPDLRRLLDDVSDRINNNFIEPILSQIRISAPDGSFTGADTLLLRNVFIALAVILIVLAAVFVFLRIKKRKTRDKTMREIFEQLEKGTTTYEKLLLEASRLAENAQYREAVRLEFIALLWCLNSKNLIYLTDYKTNGRIKRELAKTAPAFYSRFAQAVEVFNFGWFGHKKITEQIYTTNRRTVNELITEAGM